MNFKCAISTLAFTAAVVSATPAQTMHVRKLDVEDTLNQISSMYNDPVRAELYTSLVLSFASNLLPTGSNPSSEDIYSILELYKNKIGSMVMTDELELLDKDLDRTYEDSSFESELSEYVDMLHDSSAQSRIAGMIDQLANNVIEDYEKDQVNKLTGSSDDDKDTTGNNNDDNKDSKEETTSGAASTNAGMLLVLVGAVAGAMVAMF